MHDPRVTAAPNYTLPALILLGVNMLWLFAFIWAMYGYGFVLLLALAVNHAIERLAHARGAVPPFGFLTTKRDAD